MEVKSKQMQATSEKMFFFQSENYQYKEQVSVVEASSVNSFKKLLEWTTGARMWNYRPKRRLHPLLLPFINFCNINI